MLWVKYEGQTCKVNLLMKNFPKWSFPRFPKMIFKVCTTILRHYISKSWKLCSFAVRDLIHNDLWSVIKAWYTIYKVFLDIYLVSQGVFKIISGGEWNLFEGKEQEEKGTVGRTSSMKMYPAWSFAQVSAHSA